MRIVRYLGGFALLLGSCSMPASPLGREVREQIVEAQIEGDLYTVAVAEDRGITRDRAKKLARQRAAEIAWDGGYRYIVIESEEEVQMIQTEEGTPDHPRNLYQELIVEGGFSREQLQREPLSTGRIIPAHRIVFRCFVQKPNWRAIDVCTLIDCE